MGLGDRREFESKTVKIVLVNPPLRVEQVFGELSEWAEVAPPTGLCYLAAFLRDHGYDVSILDCEALGLTHQEAIESILKEKPDIVGLTCKTLWVLSAHKIAELIKERDPNVLIIAGGHHVTALPKQSLEEFPGFDAVVFGEGELTLLEYIQTIAENKSLSGVKGLAYREGSEVKVNPKRDEVVDINNLPKPAFDLLPNLAKYYNASLVHTKKLPAFPLITSRGCPFSCAFCDRSVFGNKTRIPPAEYTFSIVKDLYETYGIRHFLFDDDNILVNREIFIDLMKLFKESDLKLSFACQARVDSISEDILTKLKEAGCWLLMFGLESGSQKILDAMKKGTTVEQIESAIALTRKFGIKTHGMFIIGFPGETIETLNETEQLIKSLKLDNIACFFFTPLPGSEVYEHVDEYGYHLRNWEEGNSLDHVLFIPEGLTEEILRKYATRYNNACYLNLRQIVAIPSRFTSMAHVKATLKSIPKVLIPAKIKSSH